MGHKFGWKNDGLESQLKWFWELERFGINKNEKLFYKECLNTICRNKDVRELS